MLQGPRTIISTRTAWALVHQHQSRKVRTFQSSTRPDRLLGVSRRSGRSTGRGRACQPIQRAISVAPTGMMVKYYLARRQGTSLTVLPFEAIDLIKRVLAVLAAENCPAALGGGLRGVSAVRCCNQARKGRRHLLPTAKDSQRATHNSGGIYARMRWTPNGGLGLCGRSD